MTSATALARGQRAAERQMTTKVHVDRPTGRIDDATGDREATRVYPDPSWAEDHQHADGKAKLTSFEGYEQTPEAGGHNYTIQRMSLHLPVGAFAPQVGDIATVTGSRDPLLIGRTFRIVQRAPFREQATAYRTFVEEVTA